MTNVTPTATATAGTKLSPRENQFAHIWSDFVRNTANHVLTVLQDDGMNRRMHVGAPGTGMYSWTVVTWPGYLQAVGDIADGYGFTREPDMLRFFAQGLGWRHEDGAPAIDFRYWAQKLTGGRSQEVKVYSSRTFIRAVTEQLEEHEDLGAEAQAFHEKTIEVTKRVLARHKIDYDEYLVESRNNGDVGLMSRYGSIEIDMSDDDEMDHFGQEIAEQSPEERRAEVINEARWHDSSEHEAYEWLRSREDIFGSDVYDIGLREYDYHFILACYAIAHTVKLWSEYEQLGSTQRTRALDDFIWVEGGLIQNGPSLPVFDLDVLDTDSPTRADAAEALDLYTRISAHPKAAVAMEASLRAAVDFVRAHGWSEDVERINELEASRLGKATVSA